MVAFGTGRNLNEADRTDKSVQTIYSILDDTRYKIVNNKVVVDTDQPSTPVGSGYANLVQQSVNTTAIAGAGDSAARTFWTITNNDLNYAEKRGWYMNLPDPGERLLEPMSFYEGSNVLEIITDVPGSGGSIEEESCEPPAVIPKRYRTFINIMDGKRPTVQILDQNGDGIYSALDRGVSRMTASSKEARYSSGQKNLRKGADGVEDKLATLPIQPLRPSWRQLQ
jgi:type IV pilus assembly protein PilY1